MYYINNQALAIPNDTAVHNYVWTLTSPQLMYFNFWVDGIATANLTFGLVATPAGGITNQRVYTAAGILMSTLSADSLGVLLVAGVPSGGGHYPLSGLSQIGLQFKYSVAPGSIQNGNATISAFADIGARA